MPLDDVTGFEGAHEVDRVQERFAIGPAQTRNGLEVLEQTLLCGDPLTRLVDEVAEHAAGVEVRLGQYPTDFGQ